jgi:hypothetical protein
LTTDLTKISKEPVLASKQYISIIRLFNHFGISSGDDFNLSRAKKQLQAEFGIAQGEFIHVDGYTYTRHDVFEELEHPQLAERLVFHKQIWNSPSILRLLEKNAVDLSTIYDEFSLFWNNIKFDEFFSPYLVGPFVYLCRSYLAETNLQDMGELFVYQGFLQPEEREEAFRPLRIFLDENSRVLRNVNGDNYTIMRPKMALWINSNWHLLFNNLPDEFYEVKNDITTWLVNIGVAIQKSHRSDCRKMSDHLISLQDTPEGLRNTIVANHAVYTGSSRRARWSWRAMFWIGWLFLAGIRTVSSRGCDDNENKTIHYYYNNSEVSPDSLIRIVTDSNRKNRDSLLKMKVDDHIKLK